MAIAPTSGSLYFRIIRRCWLRPRRLSGFGRVPSLKQSAFSNLVSVNFHGVPLTSNRVAEGIEHVGSRCKVSFHGKYFTCILREAIEV